MDKIDATIDENVSKETSSEENTVLNNHEVQDSGKYPTVD